MRRTPLLLAAVLAAVGCGKKGTGAATEATPPGQVVEEPAASAGPTRKAEKPAKSGDRAAIPGGTVIAGSTPGDDGRDPSMEPVLLSVDLGPFEIDKLPYPNDPAQPAKTDVTRDDARGLCQARGERLCTELEWEYACKGPANDMFAAGSAWDAACAKDASCASGFGVLAMGGAVREWTASDVQGDDRVRTVVRGAPANADGVDHRCAHRVAIDAGAKGNDLAFRCCKGAVNAAAIPTFKQPETTFARVAMDAAKVAKMIASVPRLAVYAKDLSFYPEEDSIKAVLARGSATPKPGPVLTTSPISWTPVPNEEIVVMALRAKTAGLIVAFYRLPGDRYRLASSLVLKDETNPVVLSFSNFNKKRVNWTTCWECSGEQGAVEQRDGRRIVVVQH